MKPVVEAEATPITANSEGSSADAATHTTTPLETLLKIVSEKTGYPVTMLDPELDLEAELSIDSIKRIEIIGALGKALGWSSSMGSERDEMV